MSDSASRRRKNVFFTIAALLGVWGVLGALDVANQPIGSGYSTDEDSVTSVEDGSPAAIAGMQVGDQLLSVAGRSMDDADASGPLGRADIGETRAIVVDRGGQETTLELTFGPQLGSDALDDYVGLLMGLTILVAGLWAYVRSPVPAPDCSQS
jgi:membrane-associated protease RseP (regulator of RpoE activity)